INVSVIESSSKAACSKVDTLCATISLNPGYDAIGSGSFVKHVANIVITAWVIFPANLAEVD
ncbi:hypothetical protein, partial [Enterobacter hormaechei]|uniref:hypothetical protein n=1 Tax=Enterobacter hormaechei TaxID=158836 RepID=UPI00159ED6C9